MGCIMTTAKIFKNGRSQAVRLPFEYRFKAKAVNISKVGDQVILTPIKKSWASFFESLNNFSDDFMENRNELKHDEREELF